jgi:hypothetical protein
MRARIVRFSAAFQALLLMGTLVLPGLAFADNVQNDIAVTVDTGPTGGTTQTDHVAAGSSRTANYRVVATGGDGETGCNASVASPATVTVVVPAGATASPSSLVFTACGVNLPTTLSFPGGPGVYAISATVSDSGAGSYNTSGAAKTLYVFNLESYTTADVVSNSFATGSTVKARAFALTADWRGTIEGWRPNNT